MDELQNKLYDAAIAGNTPSLQELLKEDPLILEKVVANPFLHTLAAMLGHTDFVREIIRVNPHLTTVLNSQQTSPLHLASAKGDADVAWDLLSVQPQAHLAPHQNWLTPIHLAALNRWIDVTKVFLREAPDADQQTVPRGENILHLCVKLYQLEALKLLLNNTCGHKLIIAEDSDGNTLLHFAMANKQVETIKFLLAVPAVDMNLQNLNGTTAMGTLIQRRSDIRDEEIQESLKQAIRLKIEGKIPLPMNPEVMNQAPSYFLQPHITRPSMPRKNRTHGDDWLDKKRSGLMVVASLIATIAFQIGVNPPGGVWQEDRLQDNNNSETHRAGFSIFARNNPEDYTQFCFMNTLSFISSLSIILLLMSGLPIRRRLFVWILMVTTWVAITATAFTYLIILENLIPHDKYRSVLLVIQYAIYVWMLLMLLLLISHTIRLIVKLVKNLRKTLRRGASGSVVPCV